MFEGRRTRQRLDEVEQQVEKLQRESRALELEWETMYDKFRRLLATISKRAQRAEEGVESPRKNDPPDPGQLSLEPDDRVARLNQQIRAQRRGGALPANGNG